MKKEMELLIEELTPNDAHIITEQDIGGKTAYLSGIFMQGAITNRNGRTYPVSEISKAVQTAQQRIKESNGIFGELDHPQTLNINLDRISHVITEIKMVGENAVGRAKLLNTPMGKIAQELVASGVRIGVSSRGAGAVNESGGVTDFNFVTVDIVATPSAPGAMPSAVYEALESTLRGRQALSLAEQVRHDPKAQQYLKKAILAFVEKEMLVKK